MTSLTAVEFREVVDLLGGSVVLRHSLTTSLEAHELLERGLPGDALAHLVGAVGTLRRDGSFEKALGMSLRTYQRYRDHPTRPLSREQSGRTWKFASILAKAIAVLGSQAKAEHWLETPAMGLDQRRPIDLLGTPAGVEIVETFLERLEYGVYV